MTQKQGRKIEMKSLLILFWKK